LAKRLETAEKTSKTNTMKKVKVKDGEELFIEVPEGRLATFKWDGKNTYEVILANI